MMQSSAPLGFTYSIVRSARRKSLCIEIRQGTVTARAPVTMNDAFIEQFVRQKAAWVHAKLTQHTAVQKEPIRYVSGSSIEVMGEPLTLDVGAGNRAQIARIENRLILRLPLRVAEMQQEAIKALLSRWLQHEALNCLTRKTHMLAASLGFRVNGVKVRATRTKWGHCTSQGVIQYNWQILLAPPAIVDYLVAHEVSHLKHMNHSPAFWALVEQICPEWRQHRAWLKQYGHQLRL